MCDPDLNTAGLDLSDDDAAKERGRVKTGTLRKLARVVLFSPDIPAEEDKHWSITPISNLKTTPIDLLADVRLSEEARLERRKLTYKGSGGGEWESMIFCRVEEGCDKSEVLLMLKEVLEYYATYTQHPKKQYKPEEAYAKLVRRWPDAMFDAYTFPKRGTNYEVRKASATTQGATLDVITGPSEVSDSEEEGEDNDGDDSSSNDSEESSTNSTTNTTATTEEQEPEADSSSHGGAPVPLPPVIRGMSGGAGQDPTLNTAALDMLVTVDDADNEDNESIVNEAVAVGEEEDEDDPLSTVDIAKLMENKIPPSTIMRECFGPDSDEDPAIIDACAASAAGDGVGLQVTDENENVVGKDGDNIPAREAVTTRRSKGGKPADSTDQGSGGQSATGGGGTSAPSASSGSAAGAGGGGEDPNRGGGKRKPPSSQPAGPSPKKSKKDKKKKKEEKAKKKSVSPRSSNITFMGQKVGDIDDGKKAAAPPAADASAIQMPPPRSAVVPKKKTSPAKSPSKAKSASKRSKSPSRSPSSSPASSQQSGSTLSPSNTSSSSGGTPSPPPPAPSGVNVGASTSRGTPATSQQAASSSSPSTPLAPGDKSSERIAGKGRQGGKVKSSSPKATKKSKKKKKRTNSSSSSSSDSSSDGDDVDAILAKAANYAPKQHAPYTCGPGCTCESMKKHDVKKNITSKEMHLILVYIDRTDKARMDQINSVKKYMKKINKKMKAQGTNIVEAKKAAKEAAEEKKVKQILEQAQDKLHLPWENVDEIRFNCTDEERREKVVRVLQGLDADKADRLLPKIFTTFIHGKLVGRLYHQKTRVFKKTGRHFDRGEENFVLPPEFLELIIQRVSQTITDVKDEALRHKCIDKVDNFLAGRRTDQHRMMDALLCRREYRDDVCYWVNVHEEGGLNLINEPAPIHPWHDPAEKHRWQQIWAPKIAVAYRAKNKKECPERRTKDDGRRDAEAKKNEVRTANYEPYD